MATSKFYPAKYAVAYQFYLSAGLIHDTQGVFIKGFYYSLGAGNAGWAELWALCLGIKLARKLQLCHVMFEMDSLSVVNMVHLGGTVNAFFRPLLEEILLELQHSDWRASVSHIYREVNRCADYLAKQTLHASFVLVLLDSVSPMLGILFFFLVK